jgi:general secretion pathway protein D
LVLGGLIRDINTGGDSGVPGLKDIPLLGALFGTKNKKIDRTELLVVITPRVVRSDQGVREISQELRERMRSGAMGREAADSTKGAPSINQSEN